jgi:hypothetical protein
MKKLVPVALSIVVLLMITTPFVSNLHNASLTPDNAPSKTVEKDVPKDVNQVEPDQLYDSKEYVSSEQGMTEWSGISSSLGTGEYGNRTDIFTGNSMQYLPTNTTTNASVSIPTSDDWEGNRLESRVFDLTENRTWVTYPGFQGGSGDWSAGGDDTGSYSHPISQWNQNGHDSGDDSWYFEIESDSTSGSYFYDAGDAAYVTQTTSVPRGSVRWAAIRLGYWADTLDDTHYNMSGSFSIYINIEGQEVWEMVFGDIEAEETWYDSGLILISPSVFNLPSDQSVDIEIGLLSKQNVGYDPEIGPRVQIDNVVLYMQTEAQPSQVNLEMAGNQVSDSASYGSGSVTIDPTTPWTENPVAFNFSWSPTPTNPDPNKAITVDFSVETNMFARDTSAETVYEISPDSYGERFSIQNGTDAYYTTYHQADIPDGYPNLYFFNQSIPYSRDVFFVARPLAPNTNLTSGWSGGEIGDNYLNVSTFEVTTEAGRYGYWRIRSKSSNMIQDVELYDSDDSTWNRSANFRADEDSQVRVDLGTAYEGSTVNITIYSPEGDPWYSVNVTADSSGYATTPVFNLAGSNASAGDWMVQAMTNDRGTNGTWHATGFFRRAFRITHSSEINVKYPSDARQTWESNATYGDLVLLVIEANDTDSDILVPGGTLTMNWVNGTEEFDDNGNGEYTNVIDTSAVPGKGEFTLSLTWSRDNFDDAVATFNLIINYDSVLDSPDYPKTSGAIGGNQTLTMDFSNVNGTGIEDASIVCNWTTGYDVTEIGNGEYTIELDLESAEIGEYPIVVNASAPYVKPSSILIFVEVREIYNSIEYTANELSIPVGEAASFTLTWTDTDNNEPIENANSSITCNWTSFHSTGERNYTVVETAPGEYNITIYTESDDELTVGDDLYTVRFQVNKSNYQNHTFDIGVEIRSHNTLFTLDEPVEQTPFAQNITVLVFYQDTDLSEGIANGTGYVALTATSPGVSDLIFYSEASDLGDGHYNITIPADQWGTIGWKNLSISIEWTGSVLKYYEQSLETSLRVLGTETDVFLGVAPSATNYLDNVTFTVRYRDATDDSLISNDTNNVLVDVTALDSGSPVTQSDFYIFEQGENAGVYEFHLNSTYCLETGTFKFRIDMMWRSGISPRYENGSLTVTLLIIERPTYVDHTPVQSTPYNELANLSFSYFDSLTAEKIANNSKLTVELNEVGISYFVEYDDIERTFTVSINSTGLDIGTNYLHLNLTWTGEPYYQDIQNYQFSVTVTLRTTQLSHLSFSPPQYANNVTIEFVYTDLVAGSSEDMTGDLSLNDSLSGYYSVNEIGDGHFIVVLNTSAFPQDGAFNVNASVEYTGSNFASDAFEVFTINVLRRVTQIGFESPDPTPYQENVSLFLEYIDDTTGRGITGATVSASCASAVESLTLGDNYWVEEQADGVYLVLINSSSLGEPATYTLSLSVSRSGEPYYAPGTKEVNAKVSYRSTRIVLTKTPGETPFGENLTLAFRYEDFITGELIPVLKGNLTLLLDGIPSVSDFDYTLYNQTTYYEISMNSTVLDDSALVSKELTLSVDRSSLPPYHASRSISTSAASVERPTAILFTLVEETPYGDNITIDFTYEDYTEEEGIANAVVQLESSNITSLEYHLMDQTNGNYLIKVPTEQFGDVGTVFFNLSLSWSGVPFYAERTARDLPASIRLIQTSMVADAPAAGTVPVGEPIVVNLTYTDYDHNLPIIDATVTTNWEILHGTSATIVEIGNGDYQLTLNTTGLVAGEYDFAVVANKAYHESVNLTLQVQPGSATLDIALDRSSYYADWGELVEIRAVVRETFYNNPIKGLNASLLWNGTLYYFDDLNNGTYILNLTTSDFNYGTYEPQVSVTGEYYQTRITSLNLIVAKATGTVIPESSSIEVVLESTKEFWVYMEDTTNGGPVTIVDVFMEFNDTQDTLLNNGTPGYYFGELNTSGFAIGQYDLTISASADNYAFLVSTISVQIIPIPSQLQLADGETSLVVTYGDTLNIQALFNDTYYGGSIDSANLTYSLGGLTGHLEQAANGSYTASIDTSSLAAQSIQLRLSAAKTGYQLQRRTILTNIRLVPTELSSPVVTADGYHGENVTYEFTYNDTHNDVGLSSATANVEWDEARVIDLGNGSYVLEVNLTPVNPRLYDIPITFSLDNYQSASMIVSVQLKATPASIDGPQSLSIPVNDSRTVIYTLTNMLTNETVGDINGFAYWETIGEETLDSLDNGSYSITVPPDLPIGTYSVEIAFPTNVYSVESISIQITIRRVRTELVAKTPRISTQPGSRITVVVSYVDLDHNVGISGAEEFISFGEQNIQYYPDLTNEPYNNGTYELTFRVNATQTFNIEIGFSKEQYESKTVQITIDSDVTAEQVLIRNVQIAGGVGLAILALLIILYVRVWSIPKIIRIINGMIGSLKKGNVPEPAEVPSRAEILRDVSNELLQPVNLSKDLNEIEGETVVAVVPEVNALLEELADLTGLGEKELEAFRSDLARMKASERPGFIREVIRQEKARKTEEGALVEEPEEKELVEKTLGSQPEELEDLREKLKDKGMTPDEIEVILEQAKNLSKSDLEALLESLGISF